MSQGHPSGHEDRATEPGKRDGKKNAQRSATVPHDSSKSRGPRALTRWHRWGTTACLSDINKRKEMELGSNGFYRTARKSSPTRSGPAWNMQSFCRPGLSSAGNSSRVGVRPRQIMPRWSVQDRHERRRTCPSITRSYGERLEQKAWL